MSGIGPDGTPVVRPTFPDPGSGFQTASEKEYDRALEEFKKFQERADIDSRSFLLSGSVDGGPTKFAIGDISAATHKSRREKLRDELRSVEAEIKELDEGGTPLTQSELAEKRRRQAELSKRRSQLLNDLGKSPGDSPNGSSQGEPTQRFSETEGDRRTSGEIAREKLGWTKIGLNKYELSDGRVVFYDFSAGRFVVEGSNPNDFGTILGGPREQFIEVQADGTQLIMVGLYRDPETAPLGTVQFIREGSAKEKAAAETKAAKLRRKARERGLTAAEVAELNRLEAALAGTYTLSLGLAGGGTMADARGRIFSRSHEGQEMALAFGEKRKLKASVTGVWPSTRDGWVRFIQALQEDKRETAAFVQDLERRIDAIKSGQPDPGQRVTGRRAIRSF